MSLSVFLKGKKATFLPVSFCKRAAIIALLCTSSSIAYADVRCLGTDHSTTEYTCDYTGSPHRATNDGIDANYKLTVNNNSTATMTGVLQFHPGDDGYDGTLTLEQIRPGIIGHTQPPHFPTDTDDLLEVPMLNIGNRSKVIYYTDPITGVTGDFSIYDSAMMIPSQLKDSIVDVFYGVDTDQYIGLSLGEVETTGGTLIINSDFANVGGSAGSLYLAAKQSTLFAAHGDGTADSRIIWDSPTTTTFTLSAAAADGLHAEEATREVVDWPVEFDITLVDGTIVPVLIENSSDFLAFNDALQTYIENSQLSPEDSIYNGYITQALNLKTVTVNFTQQVENPHGPDDYIYRAVGTKAVLLATGERASVEVAEGATLRALSITGTIAAREGATAINAGKVTASTGTGIHLTSSATSTARSSGINRGVIEARYRGVGAHANNSDFINESDGIINVHLSSDRFFSHGIELTNNAIGQNDGYINVGVNGINSIIDGGGTGVIVENSDFTNTGLIYLGREAQEDPTDIPPDTHIEATEDVIGISITGTSKVTNPGIIAVGEHSDGTKAISITDTDTAELLHNGYIGISGHTTRTKGNTGIYVENAGARTVVDDIVTNLIYVDEDGVIDLRGPNATAIHAVADGAGQFSAAGMDGLILVEGGADPSTGTRSYGIWADGMHGGETIVDMKGNIILAGDGAIGLHARGNSTINVSVDGNIHFHSGEQQIGYFIHGPDAEIHVLRNDLSVMTERSVLFRVENGAMFEGHDYHVSVAGDTSIGILGMGTGTLVGIRSGIYDVTGENAMAVRVNGGARGWVYEDAIINLDADYTRGIVVDGHLYNIYGQLVASNVADTQVNTATSLYATANHVVGFEVSNTGTLNYAPEHLLPIHPIHPPPAPEDEMQQAFFLGDNSIAFKGINTSTFNIENVSVAVNGWVYDLQDGTHTITMKDTVASGLDGFLRNTTTSGNPASVANVTLENTHIHGLIQTDSASITTLDIDDNSRWTMAGGSNLTQLTNNGIIEFSAPTWDGVFRPLTVAGDYTGGADSEIHMHVFLDDGTSQQTDMMILDNSYGFGTLFIQNGGGPGGKTENDGIKIIDVLGTSDAQFELGNRVFGGAYEYELFQHGLSGTDGDWYLRSTILRPEVPIYSAVHSLAARHGLEEIATYRDRFGHNLDNDNNIDSRAWGRFYGTYGDSRYSHIDPDTNTDKFFKHGSSYTFKTGGIQAGLDLYRSTEDAPTHSNAGVFVGMGHTTGTIDHLTNETAGKLRQNSYSIGGYWTHRDSDNDWYIDTVGKATYYDYDSSTFLNMTDSTYGIGLAASAEAGYNIPLNASNTWSIEPQAQVIYQYVDIKDVTDHAGKIHFESNHNIYGRLGARLITRQDMGGDEPVRAWLRADVWQDFTPKTDTHFAGLDDVHAVSVKNKPLGTWGQVGLGVSGDIAPNVSLFASGDYNKNISSEKLEAWNARVGINIRW